MSDERQQQDQLSFILMMLYHAKACDVMCRAIPLAVFLLSTSYILLFKMKYGYGKGEREILNITCIIIHIIACVKKMERKLVPCIFFFFFFLEIAAVVNTGITLNKIYTGSTIN